MKGASRLQTVTYIVHVPRGAVLPAEVDQGVVRLLDVDLTFTLVGSHRAALHRHFTCPKLHQELTGGATGARHHAGKQSSRRHDEEEEHCRRRSSAAGGRCPQLIHDIKRTA